jgi:hypothetical protein
MNALEPIDEATGVFVLVPAARWRSRRRWC